MASDISGRLPRLLYIADVPVEATGYGAALVYRLLVGYPPEKLLVVEGNLWNSAPENRLPKVRYVNLPIAIRRLYHTRFSKYYASLLVRVAASKWQKAARITAGFNPEAVLTVTHGFSWLTAAALAENLELPLHLILHDDWVNGMSVVGPLRWNIDHIFARGYHQATTRFCVSPYMCREFKSRYGGNGQVLHPSRARDAPVFNSPPSRLTNNSASSVFAFGGSLHDGYAEMLRKVALALAPFRGRLIIFAPLVVSPKQRTEMDLPNIEFRGLVSSNQMIACFREEADALLVPMSFEAQLKANMQVSFPSKLTDYCAAGVPLLIYGPDYCSAVRWARDNEGVAEVVDTEDQAVLASAVERIVRNPSLRLQLGERALKTGQKYFTHADAERKFFDGLESTHRA